MESNQLLPMALTTVATTSFFWGCSVVLVSSVLAVLLPCVVAVVPLPALQAVIPSTRQSARTIAISFFICVSSQFFI